MCGIAGVVGIADARAAVQAMCDAMEARGPDDEGVVAADGRGAWLGSRRLAVIDPSPAGHQPMQDAARGLTLVFNGMIYNFRELRRELEAEGEQFFSGSDTEVVLRAYARWGVGALRRLDGMFALAIWDAPRAELVVARDSLGIKPLYYSHDRDRFVFASTVRALLASRLVHAVASPEGIASFLAYGAVSDPLSALAGISALPAGHFGRFGAGGLELAAHRPDRPVEEISELGAREAASIVRSALEEAVRSHLISDAPIGVFLSGGLDSSAIAALAARETQHVRTVSVAFRESSLSEENHQRRVARHIGSDHVEVPLDAVTLRAWLDDAFAAMDQPTFDGINTYVVSRAAARSGLKVALSGLGGDELFDGYSQLPRALALERLRRAPRPLGRGVTVGARLGRSSAAHKTAAWLSEYERGTAHDLLRRLFTRSESASLLTQRAAPVREAALNPRAPEFSRELAWRDLCTYTRNVLLRDTDAMSMAHSLEVRVPLLHRPLVDVALGLPTRVRTEPGKAVLARAVADLLPADVLQRKKQGFVLPMRAWMLGELRDDIDRRLSTVPPLLDGFLDPDGVRTVWRDFLRRGARWHRAWALYALYRWAGSIESA